MRLTSIAGATGPDVEARPRRLRIALAVAASAVALLSLPSLAQETPAAEPSRTPPPALAETAKAPPDRETLTAALEEIRAALGLSGFFDVRAADRRTDPNVFSMGDFEVDLERELGEKVQVAAALVVNDEGAELTVGFVDVHFLGGLAAPRGSLPVEKGFHIQLGRFDVPFGNDWRTFAAKDRTELSAPLTTEVVMDGGYNDVGLRVFGNTESLAYAAYVLRGEGKGSLVGGRLGLKPFDNVYRLASPVRAFELGVAALHDFDGDGGTEATAFALDGELRGRLGRLRAEFLRRDQRLPEGPDGRVVRWGFHVTAAFDAGAPGGIPTTPYLRYDTVNVEPSTSAEPSAGETEGRTERLTAGLHTILFEILSLKLEYQRILSAPPAVEVAEAFHRDSFLAQVVVTF